MSWQINCKGDSNNKYSCWTTFYVKWIDLYKYHAYSPNYTWTKFEGLTEENRQDLCLF